MNRTRDITPREAVRRTVRRSLAPWRWTYRKVRRSGVRWMYPELFADQPPLPSPGDLMAIARAAASGSLQSHAWLEHRSRLPETFSSPTDAANGLEGTRSGWRAVAQLCGLRKCLRKILCRAVFQCFRDQYRRDAIKQLLSRVVDEHQRRRVVQAEVARWMNDRALRDHMLTAFGELVLEEIEGRRLDILVKRMLAIHELRELDKQRREAEEAREYERQEAEDRVRQAAYAAEWEEWSAARALERAKQEAEERRCRADSASDIALSRISQIVRLLEETERLPSAAVRVYRVHLDRVREELSGLRRELRGTLDESTLQRLTKQVNSPIEVCPPHLCGTLARRVIIRVRDCGAFRDLAIIEMLRLVAECATSKGVYEQLWCSIDRSRVVRLVYQDEERPWCTVFAELQFERASASEHLNIVVSIHIPFGEGADPSPYPIEESTARVRPTQILALVPKLVVSAGQSSQNQDEEVDEHSESDRDTRSRTERSSSTHRTTVEHRWGDAKSTSVRESEMETTGWTVPHEKRESKDEAEEERSERSYSQQTGWDSSRSAEVESGRSTASERALRKRQSAMSQSQREVRVEFTPTAVGVDYSDASRLLGAWRSHPVNAEASVVFDLLCHDLPGLAEALPDAIFERRRHERSGRSSNDESFWREVAKWAVVERSGLTPAKRVVHQDGTARPIDTAMVQSLVQGMRPELRGLTDQVFALPPGNQIADRPRAVRTNDDEW